MPLLSSTYLALTTQGMDSASLRFAAEANFCALAQRPWRGHGPADSRSVIFWETFVATRRAYRLQTGDHLESLFATGGAIDRTQH